jgi:hypothetical protein
MEQNPLFADLPPVTLPSPPEPKPRNPLIALHGPGPEEARCGTCKNLLRLRYHDKTYRKCSLRGITHGPGTDHGATWPACGKYEREDTHAGENHGASDAAHRSGG